MPLKREDFYITDSDVCMSSDLFEKLFGIKIEADFSQLKLYLTSRKKIPAISENERKFLRRNLWETDRDFKADFNAGRKRKILGLGVADWFLSVNHRSPRNNSYSYNFNVGSEILGGDFYGNIYGNNDIFNRENLNFRWRYADDRKWFRQAVIGNLTPVSGLIHNTEGFQVTNSPPIARKTIGTYKIFDQTLPDWEVELYINNVYTASTTADKTGYFEFNIPLLYGSNYITLKYYGPSGEVRNTEKVIQVPFNFIPEGTVEYNISGGRIKTGDKDEFSEGNIYWGTASFLTVGSGLSYINRNGINKFYPNSSLSLRISEMLIFSINYFAGLEGRASLNVLLPNRMFSEFTYKRYGRNDYFNPLGYIDEQNLSLFIPVSLTRLSANFRMSGSRINGNIYDLLLFNSGLFMSYSKLQASIQTNGSWQKTTGGFREQNLRTSATLSYRIINDLLVRQQTGINHTAGRIDNAGIYIDKGIFNNGWLTVYMFRDFVNNDYYGGINFRFDLSFSRFTTEYYASDAGWYAQQSFYGSAGYDEFKGRFITDNQKLVSRSGLTLVPFIDANNNNYPDKNEKVLYSVFNAGVNAGKPLRSADGKNLWYVDLEPYNRYLLEVDPLSFENPMLRPKFRTYTLTADPNRFKIIPIPVYVTGSISGKLSTDKQVFGINTGGIKVIIESTDGKYKNHTSAFSDGEYLFDNLPPGDYRIFPDVSDLNARMLAYDGLHKNISVKNSTEGDFTEGVDFILKVLK